MAYKDSSGRITIDEYAAQRDIQKIQTAKVALENSRKAIESLINQASSEKGQTATAIVEKATELKKQINAMIVRLDETSSFITSTVAHYQEVDRIVKETIQNSMAAATTAAATTAGTTTQPTQKPSATTGNQTNSSKKTTSNQSSSKKSDKADIGDIVENVADSIADAFKKWF